MTTTSRLRLAACALLLLVVAGDVARAETYEVETRLAAIWEALLDVRPVGVTDNFFDLGGHSLLAIRMLTRVEEEFSQSVPLSSLFLGATIACEYLAFCSHTITSWEECA